MNHIDPLFPTQREAKLRYLDHEYDVLVPGDFVRCAMTGDAIKLDNLRYWNIEKQLAFKSAKESFDHYIINLS